mmetsp:Transcript_7821/g.48509  ORF Transcript_7821/g.48509 Transcript_7821/m.48509 type:complete len:297 (-) Transcript_7821:654-1544(-)
MAPIGAIQTARAHAPLNNAKGPSFVTRSVITCPTPRVTVGSAVMMRVLSTSDGVVATPAMAPANVPSTMYSHAANSLALLPRAPFFSCSYATIPTTNKGISRARVTPLPRNRPRGPSLLSTERTATPTFGYWPAWRRCFSTSLGMRKHVPRAVPIPEANPCTCTSPRKGNALVKTKRLASYAHVLSPWLAAEPTVAGMIPRYNPLAPNCGMERATSRMVAPGTACRRVFNVSTGCIMKVDTPEESPPASAVFKSSSLVPVWGGVRGSMVADSYHSRPGSADSLSGGKSTKKLRNWP